MDWTHLVTSPAADCQHNAHPRAISVWRQAQGGFWDAGQLYVSSVRNCVNGDHDGANCYLGTAPAGRTAFIWLDAHGSFYCAL